jgi:uncharacterized protein (DUF2062 family)
MLFRRRKPDSLYDKVRTLVWPRRSFSRSWQYISKRVLRLTASPHSIAAGVAAGVFASTTPFLGFHIIMATIICYLIRGNIIAAAIGTTFANPLTLPVLWAATLELGRFMLYGTFKYEGPPLHLGHLLSHGSFASIWDPWLKPMAIGSVPIGLVLAFGFYLVTRMATNAFRKQRRKRLAERARRRAASASGLDAHMAASS